MGRQGKPLTVEQVLAWADEHRARTGKWPHTRAGEVAGAAGENWQAVNRALARGSRGLPGGSSLARLLAERRGKRNKGQLPRLTTEVVLGWADLHRQRQGAWPNQYSGRVQDAPGEMWRNIEQALRYGGRGLPGGSSLARLLAQHGRRG